MVQFAKLSQKKSYLEDFLIFSPAVGHPGSTLRKIQEDFFKKSQVRNSHYLFVLYSLQLSDQRNTRRKTKKKGPTTFEKKEFIDNGMSSFIQVAKMKKLVRNLQPSQKGENLNKLQGEGFYKKRVVQNHYYSYKSNTVERPTDLALPYILVIL